jgi:molecular chaperone GrpE (heat shock protein)
MNSSSQSNAMAGILKNFLPVHDKLEAMKDQYAADDFGRQYSGLWMGPTLAKMGVKEYSVSEGEPLDRIRMNAVSMEYSMSVPKDTVMEALTPGLELEGNVVRAATCVVSRGKPEDDDAADAKDESTEKEA